MLHLIFADSEIERIPEAMWNDRDVRIQERKRKKPASEILLDSSLLHAAIDRAFPGESNRRGRPSIFYIALNVLQSSVLNLAGGLSVTIHTRNNEIITISPETRLPKSYNRFVGLIEDLFEKGRIEYNGDILMNLENGLSLKTLIDRFSGRKILMHPLGERRRLSEIINDASDLTLIIGGFSNGDFRSDTSYLNERYSISENELTIWTVSGMAVHAYESVMGIL